MAEIAGFAAVWHVAQRIRPQWLAVIVSGRALCYLGYTRAYRVAMRLRGGPRLSQAQSFSLVAAGFGALLLGGGFAVDRRWLRGLGASSDQAKTRVLGLGALEYAALAPLAWICALLLLGAPHVQSDLTVPWAVGVPVGALIAVWLAFRAHRTSLGGRLRWSIRHGIGAMHLLREAASARGERYVASLGIGVYWVGELVSAWAALRLFGIRIGLPELVLAFATGYAATPRGLPFAGVGVTEALMPLAFTWVGLGLAPAVLAVFVYRILTLLIALPPAVIAHRRLHSLAAAYGDPRPERHSELVLPVAAAA
jgi:uncharacterized membrane protein YbhN (UPF0104 family)